MASKAPSRELDLRCQGCQRADRAECAVILYPRLLWYEGGCWARTTDPHWAATATYAVARYAEDQLLRRAR